MGGRHLYSTVVDGIVRWVQQTIILPQNQNRSKIPIRQRAFFRLAWPPGKPAVGIFGGSGPQPVVMLGIKDLMVL